MPLTVSLLGSKAVHKSTHNHTLTGYHFPAKNLVTEKEGKSFCFYEPVTRYQIFPNQKGPVHAAQEGKAESAQQGLGLYL